MTTKSMARSVDYSRITKAAVHGEQLDLFSAATLPPQSHPYSSSHGGYPSVTTGNVGITGTTTLPMNIGATTPNNYAFAQSAPNWGTMTLTSDGYITMSVDSVKVTTIDDYVFTFKENGVERKAILAPEYDISPMESLKLTRLMYSAPTNLDRLQYVKDNNLLRHFRLE